MARASGGARERGREHDKMGQGGADWVGWRRRLEVAWQPKAAMKEGWCVSARRERIGGGEIVISILVIKS